MIYLDNNASTKIAPEVSQKIFDILSQGLVNPASQHQGGRIARRLLEDAKDAIGTAVHAKVNSVQSDQIILTSGGTEANNLAVFGLPQSSGDIVVSAVEHPSVLSAVEQWKDRGRTVRILPVDSDGLARVDILKEWISDHQADPKSRSISFVSLMAANNETGVLQPIAEAARLCRAANIRIHTDAVQAFGKGPLSFSELDVDAMTIAAHKIHGPVGVGALILRHSVPLSPQLWGGFQQMGLRPGTESVPLAVGFAMAAQIADRDHVARCRTMERTRDHFEQRLLESCGVARILSRSIDRLPNTSSVVFVGKDRQSLQMGLDLAGLACSTGSACASGSSQPSHVLQAMGLPIDWIQGGLRFSTSYQTTESDVEEAVRIIARVTHGSLS